MRSIRTELTLMTVCAIVLAMIIATANGVYAIRKLGTSTSKESMLLLCEVGEKNLDAYFESIEQSVETVSNFAEADLDGLDDAHLHEHIQRVGELFENVAVRTSGVLTYYYRIDPAISTNERGFWYVDLNGEGLLEHEVTDITLYDTDDTSQLVWFTVPKATGKPIWLSPYITDNLDARVISYNVPVYHQGQYVGVIGIELDYSIMAEQVDSITLFDSGYAFVTDNEGNIIYHPYIDVFEADEEALKVPRGLMGEKKFVRYIYDGVEKQAVWLPLSNGMRLNVTVPVREINASWRNWAIEIVSIFSVLLVVFIFLMMRFSNHITKPLGELTDAAARVEAGDYDFTLTYDGNNEVGALTRTFGQLAAYLKDYISDLNSLAYADALTSVHNKGAFELYVRDLQAQLQALEPGQTLEFAICIFDCNCLKQVNDQYGHGKGDIYLKTACALICVVFDHSPIFRLGGDEFGAVLVDTDFERRDELVRLLDERAAKTQAAAENRWEQVDVARGVAVFDPETDDSVADTVRRADKLMYEHKWMTKTKRAESER